MDTQYKECYSKFLAWCEMQTKETGSQDTLEILIRVKYKRVFSLDFSENMVLRQTYSTVFWGL